MTRFIGIEVDLEANAGYVRYRQHEKFGRNERVGQDVVIDYDDAGQIFGIELLALDDVALSAARKVAAAHDLAFPRDLMGALVTA